MDQFVSVLIGKKITEVIQKCAVSVSTGESVYDLRVIAFDDGTEMELKVVKTDDDCGAVVGRVYRPTRVEFDNGTEMKLERMERG